MKHTTNNFIQAQKVHMMTNYKKAQQNMARPKALMTKNIHIMNTTDFIQVLFRTQNILKQHHNYTQQQRYIQLLKMVSSLDFIQVPFHGSKIFANKM